MPLTKVNVGQKKVIQSIDGTERMKRFLFSLGCSEGEEITLISILASNYIINIKDSRYAIDKKMAKAIQLV
jgi:ferrous iron transport protein A